MKTNIIYLEETDSTNRYLKDISLDASDDITVVWTTYQTAGKGQGGHKWESERGKNLLFSVLLHPVNVP
ncbi:MAG TPA: biotin--[acetyl-CoA-carboxylase] ligase, partial [Xylanibacter oryzae]|nr:biotin--[acetyl-CoA-carboxylase] ligase [Xylanibacter oryzae]